MWMCMLWLACRASDPEPGPDDGSTPTRATGATGPTGVVEDPEPAQHLLMISVDTLRRDALSRYGGEGTMPFLDGLFASGTAADDHATCSNWTFHATSCTLRGAYPEDWGFVPGFSLSGPTSPVPAATPMLPTWLGEAGFRSTLVTTNNLFSDAHGNAQGFDTVVTMPGSGTPRPPWPEKSCWCSWTP